MNVVAVKDINGKVVFIDEPGIMAAMMTKGFTIFGMEMDAILALHHQYMLRLGPLPPTPEHIREVFKSEPS